MDLFQIYKITQSIENYFCLESFIYFITYFLALLKSLAELLHLYSIFGGENTFVLLLSV